MPDACHHVSCVTYEGDAVVSFLGDVLGMNVMDQMSVPGDAMESLLRWPQGNPGAKASMLGSGMKGLIEVVRAPEELRGTVSPGTAFITFSVTDLEERLEKARELGYTPSEVLQFNVNEQVRLSVATVDAGDLTFELVRFDVV